MIPPWTFVLGYEHAIWKFANKLVSQKGYKFGEALKKDAHLSAIPLWQEDCGSAAGSLRKVKKGGKKGAPRKCKSQLENKNS